jgi:hypothetical protein
VTHATDGADRGVVSYGRGGNEDDTEENPKSDSRDSRFRELIRDPQVRGYLAVAGLRALVKNPRMRIPNENSTT